MCEQAASALLSVDLSKSKFVKNSSSRPRHQRIAIFIQPYRNLEAGGLTNDLQFD